MFKSSFHSVSSYLVLTCSLVGGMMSFVSAQTRSAISLEKQAELFLIRGLIYVSEKNYQKAIENFNQAIEINPNYAQGYYQRGRIYSQYAQGTNPNLDRSPPDCTTVNQVSVCQSEINLNWRSHNQKKAFQDFNQSLQLNPNYAPTYYQKGLLEARGDPRQAIKSFNTAIDLYSTQGLNNLSANQPQQAAEFFQYINLSYAQIRALELLPVQHSSSSNKDTGGSTESPQSQQDPDKIFDQACKLLKIPDYSAALQKYRHAATLFQQKGNYKRYQETQKYIQELEKL